ncbi:rhodanese-like domain-containing protein 6 isoform X2 [Argentina anserina]|uniref:rhodanese-like domain-containing protein 6 isoform X2 n=1 Tax=Argentina anserina TaxID=57926 RepID=UPI0021763F1E|nr:rhodanese-like domain-containing protein 6 isoform X2 [Potentilla anserina]
MDPKVDSKEEEDQYGVLLYYKYAQIPDLDELFSFYDSNCKSLSLLGRVRLSPLGVNVTVGGTLSALKKHIAAVESNGLFEGTDFKLAACGRPSNDKVAEECGFTCLSIRIVKELVTLSCNPLIKSPEISHAGKHLSAAEFHSVLQKAGQLHKESKENDRELVLLDARNLYETRIGKFHTPNVETLDPCIRQYSDLPSWIDDNCDQLQGKSVLMYCTGGIRCEMASAYIRSKGAGFENVFQLYGGIQRYLEQFPDGGFFQGKNFVFDHRISVSSSDANILGACLLCATSYDDYSSRLRCNYCRMLVLVCDSCQRKGSVFTCELCHNHHKGVGLTSSIVNDEISSLPSADTASSDTKLSCQVPCRQATGSPRKLRILCLHGFRQNASSFKGRAASLAKKLKSIAELVFVDAPHELAFIYQLPSDLRELPHSCTSPPTPQQGTNLPPPSEHCKKKYAWLVAPGFREKTGNSNWEMVDGPFEPLQYQQQTAGFDESLAYIKTVFAQEGPFDGLLGFSQGAAMAAAVAFTQQTQTTPSKTVEMQFRFVILCSGFGIKLLKQQFDEERMTKKCHCPSLHIFGKDHGKDRQIAKQESRELASLFDEGCSIVIEHDSGHIIPTRPPYIDDIKDFLSRFL